MRLSSSSTAKASQGRTKSRKELLHTERNRQNERRFLRLLSSLGIRWGDEDGSNARDEASQSQGQLGATDFVLREFTQNDVDFRASPSVLDRIVHGCSVDHDVAVTPQRSSDDAPNDVVFLDHENSFGAPARRNGGFSRIVVGLGRIQAAATCNRHARKSKWIKLPRFAASRDRARSTEPCRRRARARGSGVRQHGRLRQLRQSNRSGRRARSRAKTRRSP